MILGGWQYYMLVCPLILYSFLTLDLFSSQSCSAHLPPKDESLLRWRKDVCLYRVLWKQLCLAWCREWWSVHCWAENPCKKGGDQRIQTPMLLKMNLFIQHFILSRELCNVPLHIMFRMQTLSKMISEPKENPTLIHPATAPRNIPKVGCSDHKMAKHKLAKQLVPLGLAEDWLVLQIMPQVPSWRLEDKRDQSPHLWLHI